MGQTKSGFKTAMGVLVPAPLQRHCHTDTCNAIIPPIPVSPKLFAGAGKIGPKLSFS